MELNDFKIADSADRDTFFERFEAQIREEGYPVCNTNLVYSTLEATYIRDLATDEGYQEYGEKLQSDIDIVLYPIRSEKQDIDKISKEEASVLATAPFFRESVSNFTEVNGEPIHGGEIANQLIKADDSENAKNGLEEFHDWYEDDVDRMLSERDQDVKLGNYYFPLHEFRDEAIYNGLRMVLDRKESGETFQTKELQMP